MIAAADLHLRRTTPRSRTDNYLEAQESKLRYILERAVESPPLLIAGDLFHQPRPGEALLRWTIDILNDYPVVPIVVPGQHDMPLHNLSLVHDSGLGVLAAAGKIHLITQQSAVWLDEFGFYVYGCPFGTAPDANNTHSPCVLLWHHMVVIEPLWQGQVADKASTLLRRLPYQIIITGDNHQSFAIASTNKPEATHNTKWLINPGSMMRMTAAQIDHKPCVYKVEGDTVSQLFLPTKNDVWNMDEIESVREQVTKISAFVEHLRSQWDIDLSFERAMVEFCNRNNINQDVQAIIWRCIHGDTGR